ncbi:MAG: ABC transporter ATP-binding protein/permease [Pseudomonadales bacterium]|nr:ABC transporter ATP-binding protein/permease [Pseudomonadales bacterium]
MSTLRDDWRTLQTLLPLLWRFPTRVILALCCLLGAKIANVSLPLLLKQIVDHLSHPHGRLLTVPLALILGYGALRLLTTLLAELRDVVFAKVAQNTIRQTAVQTFRHLHELSLAFHLNRHSGALSSDMARGTRGIGSLLSFMLFNILPTVFEIVMITVLLVTLYDWRFAAVTLVTVIVYVTFTLRVTEWRNRHRRQMNELDSTANAKSMDALINYETVKYFGNEHYEADRYDAALARWEKASIANELSMAWLNTGQAGIIAVGVTLLVLLAAQGVVQHHMTLGDLVAVNTFLIQLYAPLNLLGMAYREIRQALTDMERMFKLRDIPIAVADRPGAEELKASSMDIEFKHVSFSYDPRHPLLHDVSFHLRPGQKIAIVGPSGAGKSTVSRLLYRFYDVEEGQILVNGKDLRSYTQASLRRHMGVVPQDTVLFNDTLAYNIAYGRTLATETEVRQAAQGAHILNFIEAQPDGWQTRVGERGLKLSGGEKQRVAVRLRVIIYLFVAGHSLKPELFYAQ